MPARSLGGHARLVDGNVAHRRITMAHFPTVAAEVEDAYRRERTTAQLRATGSRSHRRNRGVANRVRWHHRRDRVAR
jgi:hypothetical protein